MIGTCECARISLMTSKPLRSGKPRSRIRTSGFSAASARSASLASDAVTTLCPAARRLVRKNRRMGGSSSMTSTVYASPMCRRRFLSFRSLRHREPDGQYRARPVAAVLRLDPAALHLDEAPADRKAETRAGAAPVLGIDAVELVEDPLQVGRRDARS